MSFVWKMLVKVRLIKLYLDENGPFHKSNQSFCIFQQITQIDVWCNTQSNSTGVSVMIKRAYPIAYAGKFKFWNHYDFGILNSN